MVFVSPEYNWGLSPCAKNLIDHLSFHPEAWNGKIFMCFGCSAGRGGRLPIIELWTIVNKVISFSKAIAVVSPYHIEITANLLDENAEFIESFKETAKNVFDNHNRLAAKFVMP